MMDNGQHKLAWLVGDYFCPFMPQCRILVSKVSFQYKILGSKISIPYRILVDKAMERKNLKSARKELGHI